MAGETLNLATAVADGRQLTAVPAAQDKDPDRLQKEGNQIRLREQQAVLQAEQQQKDREAQKGIAGGQLPDTRLAMATGAPPEQGIETRGAANPEGQALNGAERQRLDFLQRQLANLLPLCSRSSGSGDAAQADAKKAFDALLKEQTEHKFGPATADAYKKVLDWLQTKALPGGLKELTELALPIPANSPIPLPSENGFVRSQEFLQALATAGKTNADLHLDPARIPTNAELDRLNRSVDWLKTADDTIRDARGKFQDQQLEKMIKKLIPDEKMQAAWLDRRGSSPEEWRAAAVEAVDLATRVRNYVDAMDCLNRAGGKFPFDPPPGCTAKRDKDGKLLSIDLELPKDLRLDHPANAKRMQELRGWLDKNGEKIDQALLEYTKLKDQPERLLFWGEIDIANGKVRLNDKGEVVGVVEKPKPDEKDVHDFNLAQLRFNVNEVRDKDGKLTEIVVKNSVQYQEAHWYNYLNIGADDVGKQINVEERHYKPDDYVPIRDGSKITLVKAKDLDDWRTNQIAFHYGEKALIAAVDAGMLVTGTIEVGAAVKAARAGEIVLSQALKQGGKGLLHAALGGSGMLNNAAVKESNLGQKVLIARGLIYLVDGVGGLGAGRLFQSSASIENSAAAAKALQSNIESFGWATRTAYSAAHTTAKLLEFPMVGLIGRDVYRQVQTIRDMGKPDPLESAARKRGDGRGDQHGEAEPLTAAQRLQYDRATVDRYARSLIGDGDGTEAGAARAKQIEQILVRTKQLLEPTANAQDRDKFKQELMSQFMPPGAQIDDRSGKYSSYEMDKTRGFTLYQSKKDHDVQTAAAVALVLLNKNDKGEISKTLAERSEHVPARSYGKGTSIAEHDVKQSLALDDVVSFLRKDLAAPVATSKQIASGDLALQLGVVSGRQLAGVLQDVLNKPSSSADEKEQALMRIGSIACALRAHGDAGGTASDATAQSREQSKNVGSSADALDAQLRKFVAEEKNPDLRSVAAGVLYGTAEKNDDSRRTFFSALDSEWQNRGKNSGDFARKFKGDMTFIAGSDIAAVGEGPIASTMRGRKLNAAIALASTTDPGDLETQKNITRSFADLVSASDVAVSNKAIDNLAGARLAQLIKDDPERASRVAATAVGVLTDTQKLVQSGRLDATAQDNSAAMMARLGVMLTAASQPQKAVIEAQLQSLIDPKKTVDERGIERSNYADISPVLRKSAIEALAQMGSNNSLLLLRQTLAGSPDQKVPPDQDASVRLAAITALEQLKDPSLRKFVVDLINKETDPTVNERLRKVRFERQRLDPTSAEYRDQYDKACASRIKTPFDGYEVMKAKVDAFRNTLPPDQKDNAFYMYMRKWREETYPLMNGVTFSARRDQVGNDEKQKEYSGFSGNVGWVFSRRSTIDRNEAAAEARGRQSVENEREEQINKLFETANANSEDGQNARMAIVGVLLNGGQPFADGTEAFAAQRRMATALAGLCKPGAENRRYAVWAVEMGLTNTGSMDSEARKTLIGAMRDLAKPDAKGAAAISTQDAGAVLATALKLENGTTAPNAAIQRELIDALAEFRYHPAFPVLDAMSKYGDTDLKARAGKVMADLRDRISLIWDETPIDKVSTTADRAQRLRRAFGDDVNSEETVQAIATATKGVPFTGATDERLPILRLAINDSNERVRLAAARALLEGKSNAADTATARSVLSKLAQSGTLEGYRTEAAALLK